MPVLAMMRDNRFGQKGVEDVARLVVAFARLLDAHADPRHFLRDSRGGADLEPALRQMVEHADFLDDLPRLVIRQD
jgi:hypothetical protein